MEDIHKNGGSNGQAFLGVTDHIHSSIANVMPYVTRDAFAFSKKTESFPIVEKTQETASRRTRKLGMQCRKCEKQLRVGAPRGTKYCSAACRSAAYRERQRGATQSGGGDGLVSDETRRTVRLQASTQRNAAQRRTSERAHEPERPRRMGRRVAFDAQVLDQAPDGAVGYRVMLPGRDAASFLRLAQCCERLGERDAARIHARVALELDPQSRLARELLERLRSD